MSQLWGPPPPRRREPLDAVVGLIAGVAWGLTLALGFGLYMLPASPVVIGASAVGSAVVFEALGYARGDDFFRWVRDHWFG